MSNVIPLRRKQPEVAHRITIRPGPFGDGFDVEVLPPLAEGPNHDMEFKECRAAYGYAAGLRMVLGLPLTDLCGGTDGAA